MSNEPATPSSPWSRGFLILFSALLIATLGGSLLVISFVLDSAYPVEFISSLILFLVAAIGGMMVRSVIARSIAFLVALAALICGLAFTGLEARDIPQSLQPIALTPISSTYSSSLDPLLTVGLLAAAVISLCWPLLRPFTWANRIILLVLFGSATISALLPPLLNLQDTMDSKHILLNVALITLIQGVLFAIQVERVSRSTLQGAIKHA
jgi:hypothetical protein